MNYLVTTYKYLYTYIVTIYSLRHLLLLSTYEVAIRKGCPACTVAALRVAGTSFHIEATWAEAPVLFS